MKGHRISRIRNQHWRYRDHRGVVVCGRCRGERWPCDVAFLLAKLKRAAEPPTPSGSAK